jgi:hypothetical protein
MAVVRRRLVSARDGRQRGSRLDEPRSRRARPISRGVARDLSRAAADVERAARAAACDQQSGSVRALALVAQWVEQPTHNRSGRRFKSCPGHHLDHGDGTPSPARRATPPAVAVTVPATSCPGIVGVRSRPSRVHVASQPSSVKVMPAARTATSASGKFSSQPPPMRRSRRCCRCDRRGRRTTRWPSSRWGSSTDGRPRVHRRSRRPWR